MLKSIKNGFHPSWLPCLVAIFALAMTATAAEPPAKAQEKEKPASAFETARVLKVHITVSDADFTAMQPRGGGRGPRPGGPGAPPKSEPAPKGATTAPDVHRNQFGYDLQWVTGSVTLDDEAFPNVGIRYKGNGTIFDTQRSMKKSFKIDLDRAGGDKKWNGRKTINLHCGVTDPAKLRESLGYSVYRAAGVPAPATTLAEVWITVPGKHDKQLLGLYTIVEHVDKPFLKSHFGASEGLLMKPEGLREFEDRGDNWETYKRTFDPSRDATPDEAKRMIAFTRLVHKGDDAAFNKEVADYLDIDAYLRFLAVTAFISNSDSLFGIGHNIYIYLHPKTGRLHFIPWDLDRSFANFFIFGSTEQQMDLSMTHPYSGTHRLTDRLMAMPDVAARYQKLLNELSKTAFAPEKLLKELAVLETATKDALARDTKAAADRRDGAAGTPRFGAPPELKLFIEKRTQSVAAQLAGTSKGHVPAGGGFRPGGPRPGTERNSK